VVLAAVSHMSSSSNKLHPIYVALDSHQYNRAVKLASALPASNLLGQALYAHALFKSGTVGKALAVLKQVLWFDSMELDYEIERLHIESNGGAADTTPATTKQQQHHQPKSKKGKGKKSKSVEQQPAAAPKESQKDLIDHLTTPLSLPEGWDQVTTKPGKQVITDEVRVVLSEDACDLRPCSYYLSPGVLT